MSIVYQNNFDAETTGALPSGFVNGAGSWVVGTTRPVSGTKSFGAAADNNTVLQTGIAAAADMALSTTFQALVSGSSIATISHLLRFSSNFQSGYNAIAIAGTTTTMNVLLQKTVGGSANQVGSTANNVLTGLVNGDIVRMKSRIVGSTIDVFIWKNSDAMPSTPSLTYTDPSPITAPGYAGLQNVFYSASVAAAADDFVIDDTVVAAATAVTLTGPSSGTAGVASTNFSVGVSPVGGTITGTVIVTPSDSANGGTFTPTTVSLTSAAPTATFTYTAASAGSKTISATNNGGLTNPANLTFTATSSAATATVVSGPTTGVTGTASTNFTVSANGVITGTVVVTPGDSAAGGTFTPTTVSISSGAPTSTFTYTPGSTGTKTLTFANNGGLTNQSNLTYVSTAAAADQMSLIRFSPGTWNVASGRATSVNPGAYFRFLIDGTPTLAFDVSNNTGTPPKLWYRIGGYGPWTLADLAASITLSVAGVETAFAANGGYLVECVFKSFDGGVTNRWGPTPQSAIVLTGVTGGNVTLPAVAYAKKALFYGDSIDEGVLTTPGNQQDAMNSWTSEAGRRLGFEFGIVGFASQGYHQAGQCSVPVFGSTWDKIYSGVARDFSNIDYIFIIHGQNDGGLDVTTEVTSVLNAMLTGTPSTTKIVVCTPLSQSSASYIKAAANAIGNARILVMDTTGFEVSGKVHPFINENLTRIAPSFVNAAQALLAGNAAPPVTTGRTVTLTLALDLNTLAANLTNLSWTYQDTYNGAVLSSGTTGTTNSSGVFSQSVQTALSSGGSGKIKIEGAAGVHYNGTVVVV